MHANCNYNFIATATLWCMAELLLHTMEPELVLNNMPMTQAWFSLTYKVIGIQEFLDVRASCYPIGRRLSFSTSQVDINKVQPHCAIANLWRRKW